MHTGAIFDMLSKKETEWGRLDWLLPVFSAFVCKCIVRRCTRFSYSSSETGLLNNHRIIQHHYRNQGRASVFTLRLCCATRMHPRPFFYHLGRNTGRKTINMHIVKQFTNYLSSGRQFVKGTWGQTNTEPASQVLLDLWRTVNTWAGFEWTHPHVCPSSVAGVCECWDAPTGCYLHESEEG